jgi:hypothetical protein
VFGQLLVGIIVSSCNIVIHSLVTAGLVGVVRTVSDRDSLHPWLLLIAIMSAAVAILMMAHISEVMVWSFAYAVIKAAPTGSDLLDFGFVNYTTLGYGDIVPIKAWRLIGPMTALNGVLLIGWSTAVIFEVLRRAMIRTDLLSRTVPRG